MSQTKKRIFGYHKPVCVGCQAELQPEQNGFGVLDLDGNGEPYQLWDADNWKCPVCGIEIVVGFGNQPIARHFEDGFEAILTSYKKSGMVEVK